MRKRKQPVSDEQKTGVTHQITVSEWANSLPVGQPEPCCLADQFRQILSPQQYRIAALGEAGVLIWRRNRQKGERYDD